MNASQTLPQEPGLRPISYFHLCKAQKKPILSSYRLQLPFVTVFHFMMKLCSATPTESPEADNTDRKPDTAARTASFKQICSLRKTVAAFQPMD